MNSNQDTQVVKDTQEAVKHDDRNDKKDKDIISYIIKKSARLAAVATTLRDRDKGRHSILKEIERSSVRLVQYATRSTYQHERVLFRTELTLLSSLFDAGVRAACIASTNAAIICDELTSLGEMLAGGEWERGHMHVRYDQLYVEKPSIDDAADEEWRRGDGQKGQGKDSSGDTTGAYRTSGDKVGRAPMTLEKRSSGLHYRDRLKHVQKDRRATILSLLQHQERISVRDVASVIKDCSEKTLQRELLGLVAQGVLIKEGERRWSMYRLA